MTATDGRVVVVTGAGGGIGSAVCAAFAGRGAAVVAIDIDIDAERAAATGAGHWRELDVADPAATKLALDRIAADLGSLDVLVNCAGVSVRLAYPDITPEAWDRMFDVNLRGAFFAMQAAVPHMQRAGGGRIVGIGSVSGKGHRTANAAYGATKGGLIALTRISAAQLGPSNINVNCVCPGAVQTPMFDEYLDMRAGNEGTSRDEVLADLMAETALGRPSTPEDIADAVVFLASPGARNITGQSLNVDAGLVWD